MAWEVLHSGGRVWVAASGVLRKDSHSRLTAQLCTIDLQIIEIMASFLRAPTFAVLRRNTSLTLCLRRYVKH